MNSTQRCNRGSEWQKWDLHVHTPKTFLNNQYNGIDLNVFIDKIKSSGVVAVGITNYFRFAENELEEIRVKLKDSGIIVFPNLELRLEPFNKEEDSMHIHIIFHNNITLKKINNFLGRLKTLDDKYCKDLDTDGIKNTSISFDTLKQALKDDQEISHLKDYITVACPRGLGSFRPSADRDGREMNMAKAVDKFADILFGKEQDRDFFLDTSRYPSAVAKPVFHCSDAHDINTVASSYTWVKADPTFEGLKQTLYEPADRVSIQTRDPADSKSKRIIIDKITFKTPAGKQQNICFNKDLNAIIGVRGSGKSTLLKNMAINIDPQNFSEKDKKTPYTLQDFQVIWSDGQKNDGTEKSHKTIFYIPQGYLSALTYDDGDLIDERDSFLTSLLKQNEEFAQTLQSFNDFASTNKINIEKNIVDLLSASTLQQENQALLTRQGSQIEIESEITNKQTQINEFKSSDLTKQQIEQYTKLQRIHYDNTNTIRILEQDQTILSILNKQNISVTIDQHEFNLLSTARQTSIQEALITKGKQNLTDLINKESVSIQEQLTTLKQSNNEYEKTLNPLKAKIEKRLTLQQLTEELKELNKTLTKIKTAQDNLAKTTELKKILIESLALTYALFESQQIEIYETVSFENLFSFLDIEIAIHHNNKALKDFVDRNINTRDSHSDIKSDPDIKSLFFEEIETKLSKSTLKKLITGLIDGTILTKVRANNIGATLSLLLTNRFEIDYLKSVRTKDGKTFFGNMTGGQKAIALLELIFKFDNERYPILIDQPEDDLDVTGIASDLVNFIKSEKKERQVIIVTHNASLLICSDAENVIIAEHKALEGGRHEFSYKNGSIENSKCRKKIIKILEGGENALKQRMLKLNIPF